MSIRKILTKLNNRNARLFPKFSSLTWAIIIAFFILSGTFINQSLKAEEPDPPHNPFKEKAENYKSGNPNLENWNLSNLTSTIDSGNHLLGDTEELAKVAAGDPSFIVGGIIGKTNNLIAALYTPPASGIEYIAQIKNSFLGKPAYAQGGGFVGLQPLLPLWRGFRNIVYTLSSLVFVVMGLLIMFRVKTGPQTIVSIQNTIPKIITTLILVTFSYAIAGLLIDLMNLIQTISLAALFNMNGTDFKANLFENLGFTDKFTQLVGKILHGNPDWKMYSFTQLSSADRWQTMKLLNSALPQATVLVLSAVIATIVGAALVPLLSGGAAAAAVAGAVLLVFIINIIILIKLIQFLFGLAKVYINIILKIIFGPFEIGLGAIPGVKIGFSSWITGLVANLSVFPLSFLFLVLLNMIISMVREKGGFWAPGILSGTDGIIGGVLGFAGILLIAKLPELIPQAIYQIKPSPFGTAIGESAKPFGSLAGFGAKNIAAPYIGQKLKDKEIDSTSDSQAAKVLSSFYEAWINKKR